MRLFAFVSRNAPLIRPLLSLFNPPIVNVTVPPPVKVTSLSSTSWVTTLVVFSVIEPLWVMVPARCRSAPLSNTTVPAWVRLRKDGVTG